MNTQLVGCKVCGEMHQLDELEPGTIAECHRCGHMLKRKTINSLHLTAAFALSALLLYAPANLFPILRMTAYGNTSENTVLSGCIRFYHDGDYFVAVIVFLASFLAPFLKISGLFFLVICNELKVQKFKAARIKIFTIIEMLGKWAMLDVFALAILISLVKLQRLATVIPGKGLFAFVLVIVFTLLASASFDSQLIWEEEPQV